VSESRLFRLPVVQLAKSVPYLPLRTLSSLVIGAPPHALPRWNNLFSHGVPVRPLVNFTGYRVRT
jgi:hypothetical protein